ncbi:MAG: glycosyltransferase family 2 protein [Patescibacteria group bacterium]
MKLSIILPIYNEAGNIERLQREIKDQLDPAAFEYEIIAVDDGSTDGSREELEGVAKKNQNFRAVFLSKNYGQTAALSAGFDHAKGEVLIPMDADLQNDPKDIPKFLQSIDKGFDVVAGWRKDRKDNLLRRFPSMFANQLISYITGIRLHDYGCTMKAFRREILKDVRFYGEMHRFMPVYVAWHGARIEEIVVNHRPRTVGQSKYGISRTFRVILDLLTAKFLMTYLSKPMHFFGWAGFMSFFLGFLSGTGAILLRLFLDIHLNRTPLPLLTIFLIMMGVQFILMGILAEILIRIYHEPRGKATYSVRQKVNFNDAA